MRSSRPAIELFRRRLDRPARGVMQIVPRPGIPAPHAARRLIQQFMAKPAFVAAVAVGDDEELAHGAENAPIVLSVKYLDGTLLQRARIQLQLRGLREADDPTEAPATRKA